MMLEGLLRSIRRLPNSSLDLIRTDGQKVIAGCGFVVDYLYKHPEYADLMA